MTINANSYLDSSLEGDRIESLQQKRIYHAAVTLDQLVFVIGGRGGSSSTGETTEILRAGNSSWEQGPMLLLQ